MRPRLTTALALVAGIALAIWWLVAVGLDDASEQGPGSLSPDESTAEGSAHPSTLPPPPAIGDEPRRSEEREDVKPRSDGGVTGRGSELPRVPDDSIWIDCELLVPGQVPADEEFIVEAEGEGYWSSGRMIEDRFTIEVEVGVPFRVALARGTRRAEISLNARYHFLRAPLEIDLSEARARVVVIEPELGGVVRGRVLPPGSEKPTDAGRTGVTAVPPIGHLLSDLGFMGDASVDMDAGGDFELRGLPPCIYDVFADSENFAGARESGVEVFAGKVSEVTLQLAHGVRVSGQVIGLDAERFSDPGVHVSSTDEQGRGDTDWVRLVPTGEEGIASFECRGLSPGEITVNANLEGYLDAECELGWHVDGAVIEGVRLELDPGLAIEGQVLWPDGTAVNEAWVLIFEQVSGIHGFTWYDGNSTASTDTDAEGRFRISGLPPGPLKVTASAERPGTDRSRSRGTWTAEATTDLPVTGDLVLTLDPGLSISGRVIDDTGSAVTEFRILAVTDGGIFGGDDPEHYGDQVSTRFEDEGGQFTLEGLQPGKWRVSARSNRHTDSRWHSVSVPHSEPELELVVGSYASIRGLVHDRSGVAVAQAEVGLQKRTSFYPNGDFRTEERARTGDEGVFELSRVVPGEYQLIAKAPGFGASEPVRVRVARREPLEGVRLTLRAPARILGRIDPSAGRVAYRSIRAGRKDEWGVDITSDTSGEFVVEDLAPGVYSVVLSPEDPEPTNPEERIYYFARCQEKRVEIAEGETGYVLFTSPSDRVIELRGRVHSSEDPYAGWLVLCENDDGQRAAAHCDDAGGFVMSLGSPGPFLFSFFPSGQALGSLQTLRIGRDIPDRDVVELDFDLPAGCLAGQGRLPGGAPAIGCWLFLDLSARGEGSTVSYRYTELTITDSEGMFRFTPLPPGSYVLHAGGTSMEPAETDTESYGVRRLGGLRHALGEVKDDLVIDLSPAGSIEGLVLTPDGSPAIGALVNLVEDADSFVVAFFSSQTDADGRFEYRHLTPGRVVIHARQGDLTSEATEVLVVEGDAVEVQLQLKE